MKARLAKKEFGNECGFSIKRNEGFGSCTLHGHDFYELEIISSGHAPMSVNGKDYKASAGTVCFLTPEDFHDYPTALPLDISNVQFTEEIISGDILASTVRRGRRVFTPTEEGFRAICSLFNIIENLDTASAQSSKIASRLIEAILLILSESYGEGVDTSENISPDIQKALIYIHAHFRENPPLKEIASLLSLNEKYFCSKFKEYTGTSYKNYLRLKKLSYARRLILATDLSGVEIAQRSGYSTQSHFNREFKELYGTSPLNMRRGKK